jgi:Tfp pilus assembly protein PilN
VVWIPLGVLIGGLLLALVIFGFGAYEINWKKNRLRSDLARLESLNGRLSRLQSDMARAEARMAAAQRLIADRGRS